MDILLANQRFLLVGFLFFAVWVPVEAQRPPNDLRRDMPFFRRKLPEFRQWLRANQLDAVFKADSVAVNGAKVTLFLRPAYRGAHVCDSLQCAWEQLEKTNKQQTGRYFRETLLHKWAFMAEVREEQAEVIVRCHDPAHFMARINSRDGQIPVDGRNIRAVNVVTVAMPATLNGANNGDNKAIIPASKVNAVCTKARKFLTTHYQKGKSLFWSARVDDSYASWDEFILEVTHLSNEICSDNYYEYHRLYIKGVQRGADVELSWDFQGKYGSGILFPPRRNDYKDLETRYKSDLEDYQNRLFKKLLDYLRP